MSLELDRGEEVLLTPYELQEFIAYEMRSTNNAVDGWTTGNVCIMVGIVLVNLTSEKSMYRSSIPSDWLFVEIEAGEFLRICEPRGRTADTQSAG